MIAERLWIQRGKHKYRVFQMRERRACFGALVQIDGSDYNWFKGRSSRCNLLVFINDATGKLVQMRFVPHETFFGFCDAARSYYKGYSKPSAFYSDKHVIFHLNNAKVSPGDDLTDFRQAIKN